MIAVTAQSCGTGDSNVKDDPVLTAEKAFLATINQDVDGIFDTMALTTDDETEIEQAKKDMRESFSSPSLKQAADKLKQDIGSYKGYELKDLKYLNDPNQVKVGMTFIFEKKKTDKYIWLVNDTVRKEWRVDRISDFP